MINMILQMNPELKRNEEAVKALEEKNIFKTDIYEVVDSQLPLNPFSSLVQPMRLDLFAPPPSL